MSVKLLTEHHLEFLSLKGGCAGSFESTLVKMPHCWKSHIMAQIIIKKNHKYALFSELIVSEIYFELESICISKNLVLL